MKQYALLLVLLSLALPQVWSQSINDKWFCFTNTVIDFSSGTPVLANPPNSQSPSPPLTTTAFPGDYPGEYMGAQTAVCDTNGQLLFFVKILRADNGLLGNVYPSWSKVFDKNGYSLPHSDLNVDWGSASMIQPLIVPYPQNSNLYYVFYVKNGGLQYAVVDMSLNNGLGAVIPAQKDIFLNPYGTINGAQLMAVPGCQGIWLITHSINKKHFLSYLIDQDGLHPEPIISECGLLPLQDYVLWNVNDPGIWPVAYPGGRLVASPDGQHLAIGTKEGIELYDFEKCSGKISHPRLIDSSDAYFGLCYSPDGSRLYASKVYKLPNHGQQGQVYQFDMTQNSPQSITASKTLVISNPMHVCFNPLISCYCDTLSSPIGDLKLGPDGKIYLSNNITVCGQSIPAPPFTTVYKHHALHVIHNPNALGLACNPELNVLALNTARAEFGHGGDGGSALEFFSTNVVSPPPVPDTLEGINIPVTVCFKDQEILQANPEGSCYLWDDSSTNQSRLVDTDGVYWVRYFKDCSVVTDTYHVRFIPLPEFSQLNYGCPGAINIDLQNKEGDTVRHIYRLMDSDGGTIDVKQGREDVHFRGLDTGTYFLQITAGGGCDTSVALSLKSYPVPEIKTHPEDTTIRYGDSLRIVASGAYLYVWSPGNPLDTTDRADPVARPVRPTVFTVVGWNRYGCKDTGYVRIDLDYGPQCFVPNAFSPNGDGLNDVFTIEGIQSQKISVFEIYNRYGQLIFATTNPEDGWDGRYRGKLCDMGTYYYLIRLVYPNGETKTLKGEVNLIR